jgi:hypothetical protein
LQGEVDEAAMDINLSGSFLLNNVLHRYIPGGIPLVPLKVGEINGDTRLSGSLLRPYVFLFFNAYCLHQLFYLYNLSNLSFIDIGYKQKLVICRFSLPHNYALSLVTTCLLWIFILVFLIWYFRVCIVDLVHFCLT